MRIKYSLTHAARLYFVANCIDTELRYEELREYFSCVREVLVVEVVSSWGARGEQGEMPLEIGTQI